PVDLRDALHAQGGRLAHCAPPIAAAGSARRTRRKEKAQPTIAANNRKPTLVSRRSAVAMNGIPPAGIAASSVSAAAAPIAEATRVTISAWSNTPPNSARDPAPIAFRIP